MIFLFSDGNKDVLYEIFQSFGGSNEQRLYSYFSLNKIVPIMPVYMPFIDENTQIGFVELTIIHLEFIVATVIGSAAVDFMFIMLIFNILFLARVLTDNADELNAILRKDKVDRHVAKAKLVNILLMHREIFEYVLHFLFEILQCG